MSDGFHVDMGALERAASGVNGTLDEVSQQRVSDIPHNPSAYGHERLSGTVSDFLDRWQRGVDNLAKDGQEIATRLTENVDNYRRVEQHNRDQIMEIHGRLTGKGPDPGVR
jgi:hypothetical protein